MYTQIFEFMMKCYSDVFSFCTTERQVKLYENNFSEMSSNKKLNLHKEWI